MSVGELLRREREAAGLSQEAVAHRAGVSVSTIIRMEGGKLQPTAVNLFAIAGVLDVNLSELRDAVLEPAGT